MIANYHENRYCCNLDWLSYSVLTDTVDPEIMCPPGLRIELCQGNNIFQYRALVFDGRGAKYLTLLWHPYSKVLQPNIMTVQVANEFLYLSGQGVKWSFDDVCKIVDCSFNAISRFDVCLDFEASEKRLEFLKHLNSGHYYAQRKSEGSTWWHAVESGVAVKNQLHCLSWGSKQSEIKVKIYHKSREIGMLAEKPEPDKPWISEEWKQNNMNEKAVWRIEFSFQGSGQLRWKGKCISIDMIADESWLLGVFLESYHNRFVTRVNQGRREGHKNNDTRVWLLDLPPKSSELRWQQVVGKDYNVPASITLLRSMMRQLDNPVISAHRPTFETYATAILDIVREHRLDAYFLRTYEKPADEYFEEMSTEIGIGIRKTSPSPRWLMD